MKTDVTIISNNLSEKIVNDYKDYYVVKDNFKLDDLLDKKKVLFFNILNMLSDDEIKKIYKTLKENNILYINITNNIEEVLLTSNLIIYDEDKIILEGKVMDILRDEKKIKKLGLKLPFLYELSILLKDYNLIDKIYLTNKELKDALWS